MAKYVQWSKKETFCPQTGKILFTSRVSGRGNRIRAVFPIWPLPVTLMRVQGKILALFLGGKFLFLSTVYRTGFIDKLLTGLIEFPQARLEPPQRVVREQGE